MKPVRVWTGRGNRFVSWVDIRKDYFGVEWATDFVIHYVDGSMGIREIVTESMLSKRANIESWNFQDGIGLLRNR